MKAKPDRIGNQADALDALLGVLPTPLQEVLQGLAIESLIEVVMDLGRSPEARFPGHAVSLSQAAVTQDDLAHVIGLVGTFGADNRAGLERTLHRISAIRNRKGDVIGLTLRVGRAVFGTIDAIRDLIEAGHNLLLLGRPGVGKTTKLREVARVLADDLGRRVIVVDTSNEIGGDGDVPHPAIGRARRMQVAHPDRQHAVMIEAVENHMPEVIVIDEIGTEAEAVAARTIAERGVQLIGTAHGNTLDNLVMNPTLSDLVGGVQTVTLGDEEARFRGTQKTIRERKRPPTFDVVVEIVERDALTVHRDTAMAVDALLCGMHPHGERRSGSVRALPTGRRAEHEGDPPCASGGGDGPVRIYPYCLSRDLLERAIRDLRLDARAVSRPEQAELIVALRSRAEDARARELAAATGAPLHVVRKNTTAQLRQLLQGVFNVMRGLQDAEVEEAVCEVEAAVRGVMIAGNRVELSPRPAAVRKMQHRVVTRHGLTAQSIGSEPCRRLVILPHTQ